MPRRTNPKLPPFLEEKLLKTGQTRGSDNDDIYQNRVSRNNTVLIPYHQWVKDKNLRENINYFEKGYIVLISPKDYFPIDDRNSKLVSLNLILGKNCLVFYETRADWENYPPDSFGWNYANSRIAPLGGEYVARVPANTSADDIRSHKVNLGYASKSSKGAGIRLYEYANAETIKSCRLQLEAIYWLCIDSVEVMINNGMTRDDAEYRKQLTLEECTQKDLLNMDKLQKKRIINNDNHTICPLCLHELSGEEFLNRLDIPEGREVPDLTATKVNLFHIEELKFGAFNHRPYNLGWGCHFCNVVVKDSGIYQTLNWMQNVIDKNKDAGLI